jgi:Zinc knuckle
MSKFAPHRRAGNNPRATSSTVCQKCLQTGSSPCTTVTVYRPTAGCNATGHFTYECKDTRPYVSRPSRTAQLENPQLLLAAAKSKADVDPSSVPEELNKFVFRFFSWLVCVFSYASLVIEAELRIGFWRQKRRKERRRGRRRIEQRNGRSGKSTPPFFLCAAAAAAGLSAAEPSRFCG